MTRETTKPRRSPARRFGIGRIAVRQLRSRAALTVAQAVTMAAAGTLLASVVLIQDSSTDNGLRAGLAPTSGQGSNVVIERDGISQATAFDAFQHDAAARVRAQLGSVVTAGAQIGSSATQLLRSIDGVAQGQPFSSLSSVSFYARLRDHVRVVAGQWPADTQSATSWLLTASARATDTLGTPLNLRVGSDYCFSVALNRVTASHTWCGRMAATWLPRDVADPYWAGHVPETDVLTGHDSFFQILEQFPGAVDSALQQYVPDPTQVNRADADRVVSGVNQLRGYYSVSSNDVFVSGLDTTITTFLARQSAASGPTLVSALGLLLVAVAAMAFAAFQFMNGHRPQVALWRARGWSRLRVLSLFSLEFALLAVLATPLAIVASAAISSVVAGSGGTHPPLSARLGDATLPAVVAEAAFLVVLVALAAARSGPELTSQRRPDARAGQPRRWRRRAVDAALAATGLVILLVVRFGGNSDGSGQTNAVVLVLPVLAAGLLTVASLRLVGLAAAALRVSRSVAARLARWQVERDPAQYARLCALVTLAVAVGVFASTYTATDRAGAVDRADHLVGADMRATFSSAASPPQLTRLAAALPPSVVAAQAFRSVGRPGRTGTDATVIGIQGTGFWNVAYSRGDYAARPLPALTAAMASADPDGRAVPGVPRALAISVYSTGLDARLDVEITDASGRDTVVTMGSLGFTGWTERSVSLVGAGPVAYPLRVRALRVLPTGPHAVGDVAVEDLRTDSGAPIEPFSAADGWWQEAFAPDTAEAAVTPTVLHSRHGERSADIPIDLTSILLEPPPSTRPLPVLLASQTMASLGVGIGQAFPLHMDTVDVQLVPVGSFDEFPTHYPQREELVVAPMDSLLGRLGRAGATSPWSNELWLRMPGSTAAAVESKVSADSTLLNLALRTDAEAAALDDPLRTGLHDELGVGFVVALAVVVIGFGLHFMASARGRATQFALMRANGIPQGMLRRSLVAEQVIVLVSGLVAGTTIGLAVAWAVTPVFHLGTLPEDITPPSLFHVDVPTLAGAVLGTGAAALAMGRLVAGAGTRVDVMATVRSLA